MDTDHIPADISLPADPDDSEELQTWLREKRKGAVRFHQPQRGEKARELRIAYQNARLLLGEWIINKKKRKDYVPKSVNQLQTDLELKAPPRRIEAFDISHLGGTNTVASLVTFLDGKPRKSDYRKFKVNTVDGIDDFAAMREVVYRRYKRLQEEEQVLPDLILIDGGKGQLSMAVSAAGTGTGLSAGGGISQTSGGSFHAGTIGTPIDRQTITGINLFTADSR